MTRVRIIWAIALIAALLLPGLDALSEATTHEMEAAVPESESFELSDIFGGPSVEEGEAAEHSPNAGGLPEANVRVTSVSVASSRIVAGEQQTFTVVTPSAAMYLNMYAENGMKAGAWTAGGSSSESGGARTWTLKQVINAPGDRTLSFRASADGSTYGEGGSVSFTVTDNTPVVTSAAAARDRIAAGEQQTFTVVTPSTAMYLNMYAENGAEVGAWTAGGSSSMSGSARTWTLKQAINAPGDRALTFRASADGKRFGEGREASFEVIPPMVVSSVSVDSDPLEAGAQQTFRATTSAEAEYLRMYAEDGTAIATWSARESSLSGGARSWTVKLSISAAGDRALTFKASMDGQYFGAGQTAAFTVSPPAVWSAAVEREQIAAGLQQTFTVKTPAVAKYLRMYAENGATVGTWQADGSNSSVSGGERVWTVKQAISSPGNRALTFRASSEGSRFGGGATASFAVNMVEVTSASAGSASITAGTQQTFTVWTSADAAHLRLYAENGAVVTTWPAKGNSTEISGFSGSARGWTVKLAINTAGERALSFRASADGRSFGEGKPVTFTVKAPAVTSASASPSAITAGSQTTFTAVTSPTAKYLRVYAEDGAVARTWTASAANSTVSGSARTWTVKLAINVQGDRSLTLKASTDGAIFGEGCAVAVKVTAPLVTYRALLIGQEAFSPICTRNSGDVGLMENMLNSVTGPEGGRYSVTKLYDQNADDVKRAIATTFAGADDDDVSLFFIATHGDSRNNGRYAGALAMLPSGYLLVEDLAAALKAVPGRVIVVVESCGSGAAVYDEDAQSDGATAKAMATAESFDEAVIRVFSEADPGLPTGGISPKTGELRVTNKFYVLTASACHENSWGTERYRYNYFTKWLTDGVGTSGSMPADINDGNGDGFTTLNELYSYISRVGDHHAFTTDDGTFYQHVQVYPDGSAYRLFKR